MDAPTSQCVCRSISQANPLRGLLLSAVVLKLLFLPSLWGDGWCPDCHLPKWCSTGIRWSTVQLNLRWGHVLMRRHRRLVTAAARTGDHKWRTSPARCCPSVTDSFQDGSSACCVPRLLFPCVAPLRVWVTARLLRSACALIMSALTHSRHDRQVRSDSQPVVCLSVTSKTRTVTWGNATAILSPAHSVTLLTATRASTSWRWAGKPGLICFVNPINLLQMSRKQHGSKADKKEWAMCPLLMF